MATLKDVAHAIRDAGTHTAAESLLLQRIAELESNQSGPESPWKTIDELTKRVRTAERNEANLRSQVSELDTKLTVAHEDMDSNREYAEELEEHVEQLTEELGTEQGKVIDLTKELAEANEQIEVLQAEKRALLRHPSGHRFVERQSVRVLKRHDPYEDCTGYIVVFDMDREKYLVRIPFYPADVFEHYREDELA